MLRGHRVLIGDTRTGKTRRMSDMIISSLIHRHKVLYFGKDGDLSEIASRSHAVRKSLASFMVSGACLVNVAGGRLSADYAGLDLYLFGSGYRQENALLFDEAMAFVRECGGDVDVFVDEGGEWLYDQPEKLAGNAVLSFQSVRQLGNAVGSHDFSPLLKKFREVEFFRAPDIETAQFAARLGNREDGVEEFLNLPPFSSLTVPVRCS